jgi:hypothetical protein
LPPQPLDRNVPGEEPPRTGAAAGDATALPVSLPIPTLGILGSRGFLALGAAIGAVGWTVTALLTARPALAAVIPGPDDPALLVAALWLVLIAVMMGAGLFATPDAVRFSRPMLVWGPANGLATLATVGALLGALPTATSWLAWALAGATGYLATGLAIRRVGGDGRTWLAAAGCEALVPVAALLAGGPWPFAVLGAVHTLPLALDAADPERRLGCFAPALIGFVAGSVTLVGTLI